MSDQTHDNFDLTGSHDRPEDTTLVHNLESEKRMTELKEAQGEPLEEIGSGERQYTGVRWIVICVALYITCLLYGLDTTIAADIQGPVVTAFGQVDEIAWIGAGFPLGSVAVVLLLGRLYSSFDLKWIFVATVILFEVGSALCGAAPNMGALIVGRVIAGAGGSGIYLGSLNYFTVMTTEKERGFYMSLIGACWGLGCVIGPLIGGACFSLVGHMALGILYQPGFSIRERLVPIDWTGVVLNAGVWVTFLMAFTMAGGQWPWNDGRTIAIFVVFGALLVVFICQQYFAILTTPSRRIFPGHLMRDRTQVLLYVVTAAGTTALFEVTYYIPIYFQFVDNDSAIKAAIRLLPFIVVAIVVNLLSGTFLHLIKLYMLLYVIAGAFLIAGGGPMMVYTNPSSSASLTYGLNVLVAVGAGLSMVTAYSITTLTVKPEDIPAGLSFQNVAQIGAQVIALTVAGQIYHSTAERNLSTLLSGLGYFHEEIIGGTAGTESALFEQLTGNLRAEAIVAVAQAMELTFVLVPVAGAVMLLAALCMKREKLFGKSGAVSG